VSGASLEPQLLDFTNGHHVLCGHSVGTVTKLAGEVTTLSIKRGVGEAILAVRDGLGHDHVGVGHRGTESGNQEGFGEHHVDEGNFFDCSTGNLKNGDPIRTRRKGSNGKGLDVGSRESRTGQGFLSQKS
jgi:hypothetical protein